MSGSARLAPLRLRPGEAAFHSMWEDLDVNVKALGLRRGERVLTIASAGDSLLAYAAQGAIVHAVDVNPAQAALAALKRALLLAGRTEDVQRLFVEGRHPDFPSLLAPASTWLAPAAFAHWRRRGGLFDQNFLVAGRAGRAVRWVHRYLRRQKTLPALHAMLEATDVEEQSRVYEHEVEERLFTGMLADAFHRPGLLLLFGVPPQQLESVRDYLPTLRAGLRRVFAQRLLAENPWHQLPILLRYHSTPHHLRADALEAARPHLQASSVSVEDLLHAASSGRYDAIDALDATDWLPPAEVPAFVRTLANGLEPGGRLLLRSTRDQVLRLGAEAGLRLDLDVSREATETEATGMYRTVALLREGG